VKCLTFVLAGCRKNNGRSQATEIEHMGRSLSCSWTGEDRRTYAKWWRAIAVFYGCMALLVLGIIALTKPSHVVPNEAGDRQTWSARLQGEQLNRNADVAGNTR
jgi:hypothetical protein